MLEGNCCSFVGLHNRNQALRIAARLGKFAHLRYMGCILGPPWYRRPGVVERQNTHAPAQPLHNEFGYLGSIYYFLQRRKDLGRT